MLTRNKLFITATPHVRRRSLLGTIVSYALFAAVVLSCSDRGSVINLVSFRVRYKSQVYQEHQRMTLSYANSCRYRFVAK